MSDVDDEMNHSPQKQEGEACKPAIVYIPSDSTADVPFPKKHVFILPKHMEVDKMTILSIHHPRHKQPLIVAVDGPSGTVCELQEHSRKFGATWFIGASTVEPDSPLMVGTPIDPVFLALHLLSIPIYSSLTSSGCSEEIVDYLNRDEHTTGADSDQVKSPLTRYEDAYNILGRDKYLCLLPPTALGQIQQAMNHVCDRQEVGGAVYYCLSPDKTKQWLHKKHKVLCSSGAFQKSVLGTDFSESAAYNRLGCQKPVSLTEPSKSSPSLSSHQVETVRRKSAALIAEYLDELIQPTHINRRNLMFEATGVDLIAVAKELEAARRDSSSTGITGPNGSHWDSGRSAGKDLAEGAGKKNVAQTAKSQSVKKLEKAGAPKGTPTLLSMFANKS